jgi:hypothetical protein
VGQGLLDGDSLAHRQDAVPQVIQEAGPLGVDKGKVPVGAGEIPALLQAGDVPFQHRAGGLPLPWGQAVQMLLKQSRQLLGGVKEFPGRGDRDPGKGLLPALGLGGEGRDGVDLVPPELHPHRQRGIWGEKVHYPAPAAELARALYLVLPGIAAGGKGG